MSLISCGDGGDADVSGAGTTSVTTTVAVTVAATTSLGTTTTTAVDETVFGLDPSERYTLKTVFRGAGECLEGNDATAAGAAVGGAAFMAPCITPATGQLWEIEQSADGYYTLKTVFRGAGECLEGNDATAAGAAVGGAAFMAPCITPATGQLWEITAV